MYSDMVILNRNCSSCIYYCEINDHWL